MSSTTLRSERGDTTSLRPHDFDRIRQMTYEFCGVDLQDKQVLVSARLGRKVRELGLPSFRKYCEHVENDADAFTSMIDLLTTNHTSFFREPRHFQFLRYKILPRLPASEPIRIWSAPCSSGEEAYTIAFSLIDSLGPTAYSRASILGTDISTRVLRKAEGDFIPLARSEPLHQR